MRPTVARTRACRISSVSSSSSKVTTSLMLRTPRRRSSPRPTISRMTIGEREMAFMTRSLSTLDALGDFDFALAGEQGNGAHLAEVHADGVVGLLEGSGREIELYVVGLFAGLGLVLFAIAGELVAGEHIDALGVDGGEKVIEIVGGGDVAGQEVVDLAVGEISLFFPGVDELVYVVFVLVNFFSHGSAHSCERFR